MATLDNSGQFAKSCPPSTRQYVVSAPEVTVASAPCPKVTRIAECVPDTEQIKVSRTSGTILTFILIFFIFLLIVLAIWLIIEHDSKP